MLKSEEKVRVDSWPFWREKLRRFVAKYVSASEVDDILQDISLRLFRGLPQVREQERMQAWVYQVARSAIKDAWRREARRKRREQAFSLLLMEEFAPPVEEVGEQELEPSSLLALSLAGFVESLPDIYREILTMTELEGLTQQEAATRLGISLSGAKSRVQRGRRLLRERVEACCALEMDRRGRVIACVPHGEKARSRPCDTSLA
jgi:RNA polymerase sigma-70 factor (ECF subfamily)